MHNLLNPDNRVMRLITKIADSVFLNILWLIFCIPIITAGASTTALFDVSLKLVNDEEGSLFRNYWSSFRSNLKSSTRTWLILLVAGIVFAVDGYVLFHMRFVNAFWTILTAIYVPALAAYLIVLMYVFALMARFENTSMAMIRNSLMIGMRFLICTALQAGVYFLMILTAVRFFTPILMFGEGLCALICSYLMNQIIRQLEAQARGPEDTEQTAEEIAENAEHTAEEISENAEHSTEESAVHEKDLHFTYNDGEIR